MKIIIQLSIILVAATVLPSCNMAKHYANMRINHDDYTLEEIQPEVINAYSSNTVATDTIKKNTCVQTQPASTTKEAYVPVVSMASQKRISHAGNTFETKQKKSFTVHTVKQKLKKLNRRSIASLHDGEEIASTILTLLGIAAFVMLIIFTWEALAAFWITLGIIALVLLGVAVGMGIVIWALFEALWTSYM